MQVASCKISFLVAMLVVDVVVVVGVDVGVGVGVVEIERRRSSRVTLPLDRSPWAIPMLLKTLIQPLTSKTNRTTLSSALRTETPSSIGSRWRVVM